MSTQPTQVIDGNTVRVGTYDANGNPAPFTNLLGVATDPSTVTITYRVGTAGTPVVNVYGSSAIVKDGVGLYHLDIDTTGMSLDTNNNPIEGGVYLFAAIYGTGSLKAVNETSILITPQTVPI